MKVTKHKALEIATEAAGAILMGQAMVLGLAALTCGVGSFAVVAAWREARTRRMLASGCQCGSPVVNATKWGVRCVKTARLPDRCGDPDQKLNRRFARHIVADVRRTWRSEQLAA